MPGTPIGLPPVRTQTGLLPGPAHGEGVVALVGLGDHPAAVGDELEGVGSSLERDLEVRVTPDGADVKRVHHPRLDTDAVDLDLEVTVAVSKLDRRTLVTVLS